MLMSVVLHDVTAGGGLLIPISFERQVPGDGFMAWSTRGNEQMCSAIRESDQEPGRAEGRTESLWQPQKLWEETSQAFVHFCIFFRATQCADLGRN